MLSTKTVAASKTRPQYNITIAFRPKIVRQKVFILGDRNNTKTVPKKDIKYRKTRWPFWEVLSHSGDCCIYFRAVGDFWQKSGPRSTIFMATDGLLLKPPVSTKIVKTIFWSRKRWLYFCATKYCIKGRGRMWGIPGTRGYLWGLSGLNYIYLYLYQGKSLLVYYLGMKT